MAAAVDPRSPLLLASDLPESEARLLKDLKGIRAHKAWKALQDQKMTHLFQNFLENASVSQPAMENLRLWKLVCIYSPQPGDPLYQQLCLFLKRAPLIFRNEFLPAATPQPTLLKNLLIREGISLQCTSLDLGKCIWELNNQKLGVLLAHCSTDILSLTLGNADEYTEEEPKLEPGPIASLVERCAHLTHLRIHPGYPRSLGVEIFKRCHDSLLSISFPGAFEDSDPFLTPPMDHPGESSHYYSNLTTLKIISRPGFFIPGDRDWMSVELLRRQLPRILPFCPRLVTLDFQECRFNEGSSEITEPLRALRHDFAGRVLCREVFSDKDKKD